MRSGCGPVAAMEACGPGFGPSGAGDATRNSNTFAQVTAVAAVVAPARHVAATPQQIMAVIQ